MNESLPTVEELASSVYTTNQGTLNLSSKRISINVNRGDKLELLPYLMGTLTPKEAEFLPDVEVSYSNKYNVKPESFMILPIPAGSNLIPIEYKIKIRNNTLYLPKEKYLYLSATRVNNNYFKDYKADTVLYFFALTPYNNPSATTKTIGSTASNPNPLCFLFEIHVAV